MSATPEQVLEWAEAYQGHDNAEGRGDNENCKWCGAWSDDDWRKPCPKSPRLMAAALIRAQAERVRVLESALGDLETIRSLGKAAFGGDWGVYSEEFGPHKGAVYIHANDVDADEDGLARDYGKRICEMADNDDDEANAAFIVACNVFVRRLLAKTSRALRGEA